MSLERTTLALELLWLLFVVGVMRDYGIWTRTLFRLRSTGYVFNSLTSRCRLLLTFSLVDGLLGSLGFFCWSWPFWLVGGYSCICGLCSGFFLVNIALVCHLLFRILLGAFLPKRLTLQEDRRVLLLALKSSYSNDLFFFFFIDLQIIGPLGLCLLGEICLSLLFFALAFFVDLLAHFIIVTKPGLLFALFANSILCDEDSSLFNLLSLCRFICMHLWYLAVLPLEDHRLASDSCVYEKYTRLVFRGSILTSVLLFHDSIIVVLKVIIEVELVVNCLNDIQKCWLMLLTAEVCNIWSQTSHVIELQLPFRCRSRTGTFI